MSEDINASGAVRPVHASEPVQAGRNTNRVIRPVRSAHGVIDGDAVVAFCRDRMDRMKNPLTTAIYAGLADRVMRGFFDVKGEQS